MGDDKDDGGPRDIPDSFWKIIEKAGKDRARLAAILETMNRDAIVEFHREYYEAAQYLAQEEYVAHMAPGTSEDGADDVSRWVVAQGRAVFLDVCDHPEKTPKDVEPHSKAHLYYEITRVFHRRFKEEIMETLDE